MPDEEKTRRRSEKLRDPLHAKRLTSLPEAQRLEEIDHLILGDLTRLPDKNASG
jgi:hypothetical protein